MHDKKETTLSDKNNNFGIPEGLVAKRRDELIALKFSACTPLTCTDVPAITVPAAASEELTEEKLTEELTEELPKELTEKELNTPLSHPNKSRPKINHRPPTRKSSPLKHEFFAEEPPRQEGAVSADLSDVLVKSFIEAVTNADVDYHNHYSSGTNARETNGWFSRWRHSASGQINAANITMQLQKLDSIESLLERTNLFFLDSHTRYNNHSFASYLLDEFNKLVQKFSLSGCKPVAGAAYNKSSWLVIAAQLRQLIPVDEQTNSNTMANSN